MQFLKNIYAFQKKGLMNYFFSRDWSAAVTLPIFFLKFQQSRERLRLFPEQTEGGQALPSERDANGGIKEKLKVIVVIY